MTRVKSTEVAWMLNRLATVLLLCHTASTDILNCNEQSIDLCHSKLSMSSWNRNEQAVPHASDAVLKEFCRRYDSYVECYQPVRSRCLSSLDLMKAAMLEGEYSSYAFMCYEGAEDYERSKACFGRADLQRETQECISTLQRQLGEAVAVNDSIVMTRKICGAGSIYIGCVDNYVKVMCGDDAFDWIHTFSRKSLEPLFTSFVCPGFEPPTPPDSSDGSSSTILLAVLITIFCVIIIACVILLACVCVRRKLHRDISCLRCLTDHLHTQPPPYLPPFTEPPQSSNAQKLNEGSYVNEAHLDMNYFNDALPEPRVHPGAVKEASPHFDGDRPMATKSAGAQVSNALRSKFGVDANKGSVLSKDSAISCSSSPSAHFEPPTANPITRTLSPSANDLAPAPTPSPPQNDSPDDYYC